MKLLIEEKGLNVYYPKGDKNILGTKPKAQENLKISKQNDIKMKNFCV